MDQTLNWIDVFIGLSFAVPFAMGIAGRGVLRLSLFLGTFALSAGTAHLFSGELIRGGFTQNPAVAGAVVFAGTFFLLFTALRMAGAIAGAATVLKIVDGFASALLATAAAVFIIGAAQRWTDIKTEDSALYSKTTDIYRRGIEKARKNIEKNMEGSFEIPETQRR